MKVCPVCMFLSELIIKFTPWFYLMDWLTTFFCLELTIWLHNRLTLGLCPSWKRKRFTILGVEWSYEIAMICKGFECALEQAFKHFCRSTSRCKHSGLLFYFGGTWSRHTWRMEVTSFNDYQEQLYACTRDLPGNALV